MKRVSESISDLLKFLDAAVVLSKHNSQPEYLLSNGIEHANPSVALLSKRVCDAMIDFELYKPRVLSYLRL